LEEFYRIAFSMLPANVRQKLKQQKQDMLAGIRQDAMQIV
jgi:hypothetical protein